MDRLWRSRRIEPLYARAAIVDSGDAFNHSNIGTVVIVPLTSDLRHANLPGGALILSKGTALDRPSVANATQVFTVDKSRLVEHAGTISPNAADRIDEALRVVLRL